MSNQENHLKFAKSFLFQLREEGTNKFGLLVNAEPTLFVNVWVSKCTR